MKSIKLKGILCVVLLIIIGYMGGKIGYLVTGLFISIVEYVARLL